MCIHSRKLTWKPKKGPVKTTVLLKEGYIGFHVSLGECNWEPGGRVVDTPQIRNWVAVKELKLSYHHGSI